MRTIITRKKRKNNEKYKRGDRGGDDYIINRNERDYITGKRKCKWRRKIY